MGRTKKDNLPVKLRQKPTAKGFSLYLEFNRNGKTEKKYLGLHLLNGTTPKIRAYNANVMEQAKAEQAKAVLEVTAKSEKSIAKAKKMTLIDLCNEYIKEKQRTGKAQSTIEILNNTFAHLQTFCNNTKVYVSNIDVKFCENFALYLKGAKSLYTRRNNKTISQNTANKHFSNFVSVLSYANRKGYIKEIPTNALSDDYKIKVKEAKRGYLEIEELKRIEGATCANAEVKRAFLFSCYCGLRISDIISLCPEDVKETNGKKYIHKEMEKTGEEITIPLNTKAVEFLGKPNANGHYFTLPKSYAIFYNVNQLAKNAKIEKHISFHIARHTFATTLLTLGGDIYTASKLLGHKKITTTQIYADIVNQKKEQAVNLFDTL